MTAPSIPPSAPVPAYLKTPQGQRNAWGPNDAPIFIVLGQSNSYGHGTTLAAGEQIATPLANVKTLSKAALYNLTFSSVNWTGFTTLGDANIGPPDGSSLGSQNHCVNAANEMARQWQAHINAGNAMGLPDLHVILMGWGSQGMHLTAHVENRWSPDRSATDVESMYPRALKTLRLAIDSLIAQGKNPRILAVQWNQWETEAANAPAHLHANMNFLRIIHGINDAIGTREVPWRFFYPMASGVGWPAAQLQAVRTAIANVVADDPVHRTLIDTRLAPGYTGVSPAFGIFLNDNIHYQPTVQKWFGQQEFDAVARGSRGCTVPNIKSRTDAYWSSIALANAASDAAAAKLAAAAASAPIEFYPWQHAAGDYLSTTKAAAGWEIRTSPQEIGKLVVENNATLGKVFKYVSTAKSGTAGTVGFFAKAVPTDAAFGYFEFEAESNPGPEISVVFRAVPAASGSFNEIGYGYDCLHLSLAYAGKLQYMPANIAQGATQVTATPYVIAWSLQPAAGTNPMVQSWNTAGAVVDGEFTGTPTIGAAYGGTALTVGWPTTGLVKWRVGMLRRNGGTMVVQWFNTTTSTWVTAYAQQNCANVGVVKAGQMGLMIGVGSTTTTTAQSNAQYSKAFRNLIFKSDD